MILLVGLLVVLVVLAATGVLGAGVLSGAERGPRSGLVAAVSAPVVVVVGLAALAILLFGVRGFGGNSDRDESRAAPRTTSTTAPFAVSRVTTVTTSVPGVVMEASDGARFSLYLPTGGITPGGVVRVRAQGFDEFERGQIEQCVTELGRLPACAEPFPVQFDEEGRADFLFAVDGNFAPGGCRASQPACSLRLTGRGSGRFAIQQMVLVDEFVGGRVTVTPRRGVAAGQMVDVSVTGFPAGARAVALMCAPPGPYDPRRCSSLSPESSFLIDAVGAGRTALKAAADDVCGPRRPCGVTVIVGDGFLAAAPAPIAFSLGPGVAYGAGRVIVGVAVALLFVAIASALAAKTDWTKPAEAATPALDAADLRTDQNLDDLFGADEELDARDPIPW